MHRRLFMASLGVFALIAITLLSGCSFGEEAVAETNGSWLALPWLTLFVVWSPIWWIIFIALNIALIWAISDEDHGGRVATGIFACWFLAMEFFGTLGFLNWLGESPLWHTLLLIAGYLVGGAIWGPIYWIFRGISRRHDYNDELKDFLNEKGVDQSPTDPLPEHLVDEWSQRLLKSNKWSTGPLYGNPDDLSKRKIQLHLSAWDHKWHLIAQMAWWPWSILWSLFADVIRGVWRVVYTIYADILEKISKWTFRGTEGHFKQPNDKE